MNFIQRLRPGMILSGVVLSNLPEGGVLVNFNGHKVPVDLNSLLTKDQALTVRVEVTHPSTVLKVIERTPKTALTPAASQVEGEVTTGLRTQRNAPANALTQADLKFLNLAEGQSRRAHVSQVLDASTVIARIQGKNFIVHTDTSQQLKPGLSLPVTVLSAFSGQLSFLVQNTGPILQTVTPGQLKPYLPSYKPLGELFARLANLDAGQGSHLAKISPKAAQGLQQIVQELLPGTGKIPDAAQIKNQIDRSGIDHEANVKSALERGLTASDRNELTNNLKSKLLQLIHTITARTTGSVREGSNASGPPQPLNETLVLLQKALDSIEFSQLSNQYAKQENQPLLLQIPNPFAHGDPTLKLYLRPSGDDATGGNRGGKKHFNLVFLLEMSVLGNLRVDSHVGPEGLAVTIYTERAEVAQYINTKAEQFAVQMSEMGFKTTLTSQVREKVTLPEGEDISQALIGDPTRLVDIRT